MRISRRSFFLTGSALLGSYAIQQHSTSELTPKRRVHQLTQGPKNHFFGYYDISPWNASEKQLVCLETTYNDRRPEPGEAATIALVDARSGSTTPVTETRAWNFQQGAMLHWNPLQSEDELLFNDQVDGTLVSVCFNSKTGKRRILPRVISGLCPATGQAVSLTYGRVGRLRKVVGYAGAIDPNPDHPHPDTDGIFRIDLRTGETKLIVSLAAVYEVLRTRHPELDTAHLWFNHTVINPGGTRLLFLARARLPEEGRQSGMFTVGIDGSDLREVVPFGSYVSHFAWRNDTEICATCLDPVYGKTHVLFTDGQQDHRRLGDGSMDFDGHCAFRPQGDWLVSDHRHHDTLESELVAYHVPSETCQSLHTFDMLKKGFLKGDFRCDLHPRWNAAGTTVCVDAPDPKTGLRQMWLAEDAFRA